MKKTLLLFIFAFVATVAYSQNELYSFMYRQERNNADVNFMQQRDGDFIILSFVADTTENPYMGSILGSMFYKVSANTLSMSDSLFVEETIANGYLLARDPRGDGNLMAYVDYHEDSDSSYLRISRFSDDDLVINHQEDVLVPLSDEYVYLDSYYGNLIDSRGDMIIKYGRCLPDEIGYECLARISPDGTMKHQAIITENATHLVDPLRELSDSPLQYYLWDAIGGGGGFGGDFFPNLAVYTIDSLFHKNTIILNKILHQEVINPYATEYTFFRYSDDTEVIPIGDNKMLVAAPYELDTNFLSWHIEEGVAMAKFDIRTMQLEKYVTFNDYSGPGHCLGLKMMPDGSVYLLYREYGYPAESFIAVKLDTDLNVEWKRFCKTGQIHIAYLQSPIMYDNLQGEEQGIAWLGSGRNTDNNKTVFILFLFNHDGIPASVDNGIDIRPYASYPNPAQDLLHINYSPDVQPKLVELYDLQGRLVRSQSNALESLSLQGLAAGQYVMKVTMEDGTAYSDKVVKE